MLEAAIRPLLVVLALLVAAFAGAFLATATLAGHDVRPEAGNAALQSELGELRSQLQDLAHRVEGLTTVRSANVENGAPLRSDAAALAPRQPGGGDPERRDAHWYLEQYVLSFATDALGSEYFRLAVEAYVGELASSIAAVVRDAARPVPLREALVAMLGKRRFADAPDVLDALLAAASPRSPESLVLRALEAIARIGSANALAGLQAMFPSYDAPAVRENALAVILGLAGEAQNQVLQTLFARAADDAMRQLLIARLDGADQIAALELLRAAAGGAQPVRLIAAKKVGDYDEPEFDVFVGQWRQVEADAEVQAALGAVQSGAAKAGWSPRQAAGAPDADRTRDDPKAWAPREPQMGMQWLQLVYALPMPATGVRIFEVNSPGAIAEVLVRAADGPWVSVWRGTANDGQAPLVLAFPRTAFAVKTVRLVLDTNRTQGWNEIDAVELLGPSGSQWAVRASASSTYATRQTSVGDARSERFGNRTLELR